MNSIGKLTGASTRKFQEFGKLTGASARKHQNLTNLLVCPSKKSQNWRTCRHICQKYYQFGEATDDGGSFSEKSENQKSRLNSVTSC